MSEDNKSPQPQRKQAVFDPKFENWDSFTQAQKYEFAANLHSAIIDEFSDDEDGGPEKVRTDNTCEEQIND